MVALQERATGTEIVGLLRYLRFDLAQTTRGKMRGFLPVPRQQPSCLPQGGWYDAGRIAPVFNKRIV